MSVRRIVKVCGPLEGPDRDVRSSWNSSKTLLRVCYRRDGGGGAAKGGGGGRGTRDPVSTWMENNPGWDLEMESIADVRVPSIYM